jgi:hypothetical protein
MGSVRCTRATRLRRPAGAMRSNAVGLAVAAAFASMAPRDALAESAPASLRAPIADPQGVREAPADTRWYGYQAAIADAAAIGLAVGAVSTFKLCLRFDFDGESSSGSGGCDNATSTALGVSSLAVYALGAPIIHTANGHPGKAGLSLGIRAAPFAIGLPLAAANGGAGVGVVVVGMFTAMFIDDLAVATEVIPRPLRLAIVPSFDPQRRVGMVFVGSEF